MNFSEQSSGMSAHWKSAGDGGTLTIKCVELNGGILQGLELSFTDVPMIPDPPLVTDTSGTAGVGTFTAGGTMSTRRF